MAMLEVKDLEVYYGMIQAIKEKLWLLSEQMEPERQPHFIQLQVFFRQRKEL